MGRIVVFLGMCLLLAGQFEESRELYGGIDTENYFALLLGTAAVIVCFVKVPGKLYAGDVAGFGLFVYLLVHAGVAGTTQSREFYLSISYFALYAVFRTVREMRMTNYASLALMAAGIYQSYLVLEQLLGHGVSNHYRFAVTGSFYNPGPCGIFLAGIFVLSVAMVRKGYRKAGMNVMFVRYVTAWAALSGTWTAMVPAMSRAGWVGAAAGVALLYRKEILKTLGKCRHWMAIAGVVALVGMAAVVYLLKKDSADGRLFIWRNVVAACEEAPVFGVGIDGFERAYAEAQHDFFQRRNVLEQNVRQAEVAGVVESAFNEPLALFLLLGSVGGMLGISVLFFKLRRLNEYGCVASALLVASLFSYPFYVPAISMVFVFALAQCPDRPFRMNQKANRVMWGTVGMVALFFNCREYGKRETYREWKEVSVLYSVENFQEASEEYARLYSTLHHDHRFLFEYGRCLNKTGEYEMSSAVLKEGIRHSADPMFWNVMGNNYLAMKQYSLCEKAYLRAYYTCPNRIYPLYLLVKMSHEQGDSTKMRHYAQIMLNKQPKVESPAVEEMKEEVRKMLDE